MSEKVLGIPKMIIYFVITVAVILFALILIAMIKEGTPAFLEDVINLIR